MPNLNIELTEEDLVKLGLWKSRYETAIRSRKTWREFLLALADERTVP